MIGIYNIVWAGGGALAYFVGGALLEGLGMTSLFLVPQELAAVSFKEYGLQDANTLEATQTMVESRAVEEFLLNDQEILIRHFHKETSAWVDDYRRETAGV